MSGDEEGVRVTPRDAAGDQHYGEALLYDFAKFVTTLSLLALGGLLTLREAARAGDLKVGNIVMISAAIMLAGAMAFVTASAIAYARAAGKAPARYLPKQLSVAVGVLGFGVGGFVMAWLDTLS